MGGALSIAPLSQSSAATRSATGYPTSTRTSGPLPTPGRPLSRSRTGPAEMPIHGCGAAAASASARIIIASASRREDEGVRDEYFAAAAVGPDAREAEARSVAAAAAPAERLQTHAALAARLACFWTREMAHRVAGALLERDAEHVALPVSAAQRLEHAGLRDQRPVI